MAKARSRTIGVVLSTELACWREVIRGINTVVTSAGDWRLELLSPMEDFVNLIRRHRPHGLLLGPLPNEHEAIDAVAAHHGPVIGVASPYHCKGSKVNVRQSAIADDEKVGRMAASHFMSKGYRNFGFLGTIGWWSDERCTGFEAALAEAGFKSATIIQGMAATLDQHGWPLPHFGREIYEWLRDLPKPVGVLACNDLRGRELAEVCRTEGIRVPDDVAILGVDNDDLECMIAHPPLSSIAIPWRQVGAEGARCLAAALDGKKPSGPAIRVPPTEVVERQSTDTIAIADPDISAAIQFIREHAHEPVNVEDVLRVVPAARRSLEKRFKTMLGRSPLDEIRRAHVERAKHLLVNTDLSVADIAERSGFTSPAWFSKAFRALSGETPRDFRDRFRSG